MIQKEGYNSISDKYIAMYMCAKFEISNSLNCIMVSNTDFIPLYCFRFQSQHEMMCPSLDLLYQIQPYLERFVSQGKILHILLFIVTVVLSVWLDGFGSLRSSKVELLSPNVPNAVFISSRVFILFCRVQSFVNSFWSSSSMLNTAAIELKNLLN